LADAFKEDPREMKEKQRTPYLVGNGQKNFFQPVSIHGRGGKQNYRVEIITASPRELVKRLKRAVTGLTKVGMTESGFLWGFPVHLF